MDGLKVLGWSDWFAAAAVEGAVGAGTLARVTAELRGEYRLRTAGGEFPAQLAPRLRKGAADRLDRPMVGDWVVVEPVSGGAEVTIHDIMPRKTLLARRGAGGGGEVQPIAANVDLVFIVMGLDGNYNPRRLERYLVAARESGAEPVVILSKADLCPDTAERVAEAEVLAHGARVVPVSSLAGEGVAVVREVLAPGVTACFVGSSGVGKSTLVNRLAGEEVMATGAVRERDAKGRHTTTHRQMILLPCGAIVIDTPGMREFGLWQAGEGLAASFPEIAELARRCRFHDCSHAHEPGCAVRDALAVGEIDQGRYASYLKLRKEDDEAAARDDVVARQERKGKERRIAKGLRVVLRKKGKK
ncbi:ribosome biogenesis GTPase / thiamine phosphate phosphatase [Rhodocyclaceae bacterium]|nr:ribosome biogenesis GTPase / thiamine phosphate phosphatase [Rhodocyclaceae bacterium]